MNYKARYCVLGKIAMILSGAVVPVTYAANKTIATISEIT